MNNCKQIVPAEGWFFVHKNTDNENKPYTVYPVVVWALSERNDVVGLIQALVDGQPPKFVPPPSQGSYIHSSQLTNEQLSCLPISV